jgi:sugar-specific transcriptional regulator TrmB
MGIAALRHVIQSVGLDTEEAALYIAGLKLGTAPASAYAKKTGFNRITTYNNLEKLTKRGIFSVVRKRNAKSYQPISPEKLSIEARKNVEALERILPDLRGIMGNHHRTPRVRYFEGMEGVRKVYEDTLTADGLLLNFANSKMVRSFWKDYDTEYVAERVKKGIFLKGIAPDDEAGRKVQGEDKINLREIRLVSVKDFPLSNEIKIYDNKVAIVSFPEDESEIFGVIIESKEVADTQRQIFEMAWRYAALGEGARRKEKLGTEETKSGKTKVRKDQLAMFGR